MVDSALTTTSTILVGMSLDDDESNELLSWTITILARPNDAVIALHVLAGEAPKKLLPRTREHKRLRRSKSVAISAVGEFAKICQSKQVQLEARVKYSSSIKKGLIEEARGIPAQFLILGGGTKIKSNRPSHEVTEYCFKNAPKGCSVFSLGKSGWPKEQFVPDFSSFEAFSVSDSSSVSKEDRGFKDSPRTVLHRGSDRESLESSDDRSSTSSGSSTLSDLSSPYSSPIPNYKQSPLRRFSSFLRLPFHLNSRKKIDSSNQIKQQQYMPQQPLLRCFSYNEISEATNNFHPDYEVGRGGYSEVYKGDVRGDNGINTTIAVKRLAREDTTNPRKEKEFLIELGIIGQVSHPNTACLVGYCIENGLCLIFEFSPNGNLYNALHGDSCELLKWAVRYEIVLGITRGLHYLHKCCKHKIIHRDIKASNVLLGPEYEPKISDFGLAKWLPSKSNHHAIAPTIEGTFGYLAPEYFMHGMVDEKTDVYAFGVLLLEIVTGKRPVDQSSNTSLLVWARPLIESEQIDKLVDPRLGGSYDADQLNKIVLTASYCVQQSSALRPSMTEVLELLEKGHDAEPARARRTPKILSDEMDDYSMAFGYSIPIDFDLDEEDDW